MKWIIDRFEGDKAVIEVREDLRLDLPRASLPEGAKEGDVIALTIDTDETDARRKKLAGLRKRLFVD